MDALMRALRSQMKSKVFPMIDGFFDGKGKFVMGMVARIAIILVTILITLQVLVFNFGTQIAVSTFDESGRYRVQVFYNIGNGFNETDSVQESNSPVTTIRIPPFSRMDALRIDFSNRHEPHTIGRVMFVNSRQDALILYGNQITEFFTPVHVDYMHVDGTRLTVFPSNNDSQFIATQEFLTTLHEHCRFSWERNIVGIVIALILWGISIYSLKTYFKHISYIKFILMGFVCVLVFTMAWRAPINSAPDEPVTISAIRYYETSWLRPDVRSPEIARTFSVFGNTRLREFTPYYFIAGKLSVLLSAIGFFTDFLPYRLFSVFMFSVIICLLLTKYKTHPFMTLAICITPQLWYIFTYATSDAFDFFISFLVIGQVIDKESYLNKFIESKTWKLKYMIVPSVLIGCLWLAKINFYIVLLVIFIHFGRKSLEDLLTSKTLGMFTIKKYALLSLTTLIFPLAQLGYDFMMYGFNRREILSAIRIERGHPSLNDPELFQRYTGAFISLRESGVSLHSLLTEYSFFSLLHNSFVGKYGWMQFYSSSMYGNIMLIIYIIIIGIACISVFQKSKDRQNNSMLSKLETIVLVAIIPLNIAAVVYQSWFNDFQPQGRYLLPSIFAVILLCAKIECKYMKTMLEFLQVLLLILGIHSFITVGMMNLVF